MKLEKISDRVFVTPGSIKPGESNAGVIVLDSYAIVVDSYRYPKNAFEFRRAINNDVSEKVKHLLLTHSHGDHVFGCQVFEDCNIVSQDLTRSRIEDNLKSEWSPKGLEAMKSRFEKTQPERAKSMEGLQISTPTMSFNKKISLWDNELTVIMEHVGGHTSGSSIVYFPHDEILFTGDLIFARMFPWGGDPTGNPNEWIIGLRKILKMKIEKIVPGHGMICDKREIETYLHFLEGVEKQIREMIAEEKTENEIIRSEFPKFYGAWSSDMKKRSLTQWYRVLNQKTQGSVI